MITTKQIDVKLEKGQRNLKGITTKNVDASIRVPLPITKPVKSPLVSTHNIVDVADLAEKKKRDEIMASRQVIITEQKAAEIMSAAVEQGKETIEALATAMKDKKEEELLAMKKKGDFQEGMTVYQSEINELEAKKKAAKEKMAKVRAAKKKKK